MEWSTAIVCVPGCHNKPSMPVADYCVGWSIRPLADNTILHLSELDTGCVRLLGHQITSPPEPRRIVLLVSDKPASSTYQWLHGATILTPISQVSLVLVARRRNCVTCSVTNDKLSGTVVRNSVWRDAGKCL